MSIFLWLSLFAIMSIILIGSITAIVLTCQGEMTEKKLDSSRRQQNDENDGNGEDKSMVMNNDARRV